ncbi:MAG: hypothetical protein AAGU21_09880 [Solidesulfovibrio sp.]|uniref:hypothetical protein n=1 Tax=Solidesulfovibrio sp. TaxID=2910990 RepID=UPI002B1E9E9E|nr:hypothetical protein [Solidesulfovibrio sp.]MEA4858404.1 hypothetical protein [Solidesulfovibrio sp.]
MGATEGKLGRITNFFIKHAVAIFLVATFVCLVLAASLTSSLKPNVVGVWLVVGILTSLLFSGVALVVVLAVAAVDKARRLRLISYEPKAETLRRDRFEREKLAVADFHSPLLVAHDGKRFEECGLAGPGSVYLDVSCEAGTSAFHLCDLIVVPEGEKPYTAAYFHNSVFRHCRFDNLVVYMTEAGAEKWLQGREAAGIEELCLLGRRAK